MIARPIHPTEGSGGGGIVRQFVEESDKRECMHAIGIPDAAHETCDVTQLVLLRSPCPAACRRSRSSAGKCQIWTIILLSLILVILVLMLIYT